MKAVSAALALALILSPAEALSQSPTSTAAAIRATAATPPQTRSNAAATGSGAANILIAGSNSSQSDNCSTPNSLAFGDTMRGFGVNFQRSEPSCVRIRKARVLLDIAVVSGNRQYAQIAAALMEQDADVLAAFVTVLGK